MHSEDTANERKRVVAWTARRELTCVVEYAERNTIVSVFEGQREHSSKYLKYEGEAHAEADRLLQLLERTNRWIITKQTRRLLRPPR